MKGWQCPSCGRCYSPFVVMCPYCYKQLSTGSGTSWISYDVSFMVCPKCGKLVGMSEFHQCEEQSSKTGG